MMRTSTAVWVLAVIPRQEKREKIPLFYNVAINCIGVTFRHVPAATLTGAPGRRVAVDRTVGVKVGRATGVAAGSTDWAPRAANELIMVSAMDNSRTKQW